MPVLLLLKGQPGTGKSTLGAALVKTLKWPLISKDAARDALQPCVYQATDVNFNDLSYVIMWSYCESQLAAGLDGVVVDSPLARRELFTTAMAVAQRHGATVALVECVASDKAVWRQRLEERGREDVGTHRSHKPGSWEDLQHVMQRNAGSEAWSSDATVDYSVVVDTTASGTEELVEFIIRSMHDSALFKPSPLQ